MKHIAEKHRAKLDSELTLSNVPSGTRAVVHRINAADESVQRLMAMGLCVGRELEVIRQGNPLIVRMLGARIGVSGRVAKHILVNRS
jgi:Fe2+ transport system protein FeoA